MATKKQEQKMERLKRAENYQNTPGYMVLGDDNSGEVMKSYSKAVAYDKAVAFNSSRTTDFSNMTTYISGKPGLTGEDFDWFRPEQAPPKNSKQAIAFGRYSYRRIGLIRNAIDIMGDFTTQGVRISHPNKSIETICKAWWDQINGDNVSERFCNLLFREANNCIRIKTAKLNKSQRNDMRKAIGRADMKVEDRQTFDKGEIPWQYVFIDPLLVDPVGNHLSNFVGRKTYRLTLPPSIQQEYKNLLNSADAKDKDFLNQVPEDIKKAILESGHKGIPLDNDKFKVFHYKKDDWQSWADPITSSAYRDLRLYEKLKLTDDAALDGAVSKIRVWKLGNIDAKLYPTPAMSQALNDILSASVGGGVQDIIWGPDIELVETSTDIQSFLGEEKYKPTLMAIYACLGIPPTLTGTFGASGTTNNFISLKALTERLTYVRNILMDFWREQLRVFQQSMGFRRPPELEFDFPHLDDPAAIMQLLLNMADRNILSDEFVQRYVKAIPEVERQRIADEEAARENGTMPEKASPYHQASQDFQLKRLALQTGVSSPSEVGLELEDKKKGEKSMLELRQPTGGGGNSNIKKSPNQPGRPQNSKDGKPRKERQFTPKQKAAIFAWAKDAQDKIANFFNPVFLEGYDKKNMRSLSSDQYSATEAIKFQILCNLQYSEDLNEKSMIEAYKTRSTDIDQIFKKWVLEQEYALGRQLKVDEIRDLRSLFYVEYNCGELS